MKSLFHNGMLYPVLGTYNPEVNSPLLHNRQMREKKQSPRGPRMPSAPARRIRAILAANIRGLLDHHFPRSRYKNARDQFEALGKSAGVSPSTVQRAIDPNRGYNIDIIVDLAVAFEIKVVQLFDPKLMETVELRRAESGEESRELQRNGG